MKSKKPERLKPLSVYPLKWWEAMTGFMQISPRRAKKIREQTKA